MNQNAFSLGLTYLVPAFLSLSAMTGSAGAVTLDGGGITIKPTLSTVQFFGAMASDGGVVTVNEIGSTPAPPPAYELRAAPEATTSRLRCWQHGKSVVDEPIAQGPVASAAPLLTAPGAGGQRVMVLAGGTGLCIVTHGQPRNSSEVQN